MDKIKLIHDTHGQTLTVWFDDPAQEHVAEETADEVVVMRNASGRVIGLELLHYRPAQAGNDLAVETLTQR